VTQAEGENTEIPPDFREIHQIAELFHQLHHTANPESLSKEAERILGATAPEDEFMAIATWCGRCSLIHKMAPDKYPSASDDVYKVPDLFAVFEYEGRKISSLIEVKSTYTTARPGPIKTAKISPNYKRRLQNYGKLLGLPVLIAQQIRPGGFWLLVDLETIGTNGVPNTKEDLSSTLLGAFSLVFRAGTKFVLRVERQEVFSDKEFNGVIREAYFETANGEKLSKTHSPMMLLLGLGDPIDRQEDDGKTITMIFEIPADIGFFNYQALRAAIAWDKELSKEEFPWTAMLKSGKFPISYLSIEDAHNDANFFKFSMRTRPQHLPNFLAPK
jgi:hypothetical protein